MADMISESQRLVASAIGREVVGGETSDRCSQCCSNTSEEEDAALAHLGPDTARRAHPFMLNLSPVIAAITPVMQRPITHKCCVK